MKNLKNISRIFVVALVALFSVALTSSATAADTKGTDPVVVKYVGASDNIAIFELSFTNEKEEQFEIMITDKYNSLYYEKVKGTELSRKFQFLSTDADGGSVNDEILVVITNTATKEVSTYKILPNASIGKDNELVAKL
jgi:hypothetical protein